jgi:chromate transporter
MNLSTSLKDPISDAPSFRQAFRFWLKLGWISFGGPTGQISIMHTELVEKKKWISEETFLHALNFCMLLPGPEAQQLAIYIGWLLHGTWGGIVAGSLFVIPSMFVLYGLSYVYAAYGKVFWIAAIFYGLKPAVLAIVLTATIRIGKKSLKNSAMWMIATLSFIAIFFFKAPFPFIILGAGFVGWMIQKFTAVQNNLVSTGKMKDRRRFYNWRFGGRTSMSAEALTEQSPPLSCHLTEYFTRNALIRMLRVIFTCLLLWWTPVVLLVLFTGKESTFVKEGLFFSKAAMITFGGAYAVLPYVAQQAVETYKWLTPAQMMDGLGLAETTPGPLIMVLQFVGFMGGWTQPGMFSTLMGATLGALITTWCTFVPCFLWIFLGAPYVERIRGNLKLAGILSAITAAVVGVILNLAVWFGIHVIVPSKIDWFAFSIALFAFLGMLKWKWNMIAVVFCCGLLGLIVRGYL